MAWGFRLSLCDASTPLNSPKHPCTEGGLTMVEIRSLTAPIPDTFDIPNLALPLIESSARPLPSLGLVSPDVLDLLLKDASQFITEFDDDVGTLVTFIYDRCFLNEVFIDQNLSLLSNKEKHEKIRVIRLLCIQQAFALRSASIS